MVKYTLYYFNMRGRGETIRLIFAAAGVKYEDKRIEQSDWPALKPTMPSGTMPVLDVGGERISESMAICRFLAKETGLAGKKNIQQAHVDGVVDVLTDIREAYVAVVLAQLANDPTKVEDMKKALVEMAPKILEKIEKKLQANKGGKAYIVGDKVTWADLHFVTVIQATLTIVPDVLDKFPGLKALKTRVEGLPKIAKYLKERPETPF